MTCLSVCYALKVSDSNDSKFNYLFIWEFFTSSFPLLFSIPIDTEYYRCPPFALLVFTIRIFAFKCFFIY